MGRCYLLSKKISFEEEKEIIREIKELNNVKAVRITDDRKYLVVETKDGDYSEVMYAAVNICNRIGEGLEISFSKFELELEK